MQNTTAISAEKPQIKLIDQHSSAVVVGLGATGYSMVRYLRARGLDVHVVDTREEPPFLNKLKEHYPTVTYQMGEFADNAFVKAELLVVSPGVALKQTPFRNAKQAGVVIVGDIELFIQENEKPVPRH